MKSFKQYYEDDSDRRDLLAGVSAIHSGITTGEVKLVHHKSWQSGTDPHRLVYFEGVWSWITKFAPLVVWIHPYHSEIKIEFFSNGFGEEGQDTVPIDDLQLPEKMLNNFVKYMKANDVKAATVELEAWLESPKVSKIIKQTLNNTKGFKYFRSSQDAEYVLNHI